MTSTFLIFPLFGNIISKVGVVSPAPRQARCGRRCVFLWFIMHFDFGFHLLEDEQIDQSMLATVGGWLAWLLKPLGFGTWQGAAASVSAEIAKEQATATLGLVAAL